MLKEVTEYIVSSEYLSDEGKMDWSGLQEHMVSLLRKVGDVDM